MSIIEFDICHRLTKMRMLHLMNLTWIFTKKNLIFLISRKQWELAQQVSFDVLPFFLFPNEWHRSKCWRLLTLSSLLKFSRSQIKKNHIWNSESRRKKCNDESYNYWYFTSTGNTVRVILRGFIFKISHFLVKQLPLKIHNDNGCPPADLAQLSKPAPLSCTCLC